jgi:hypothetical protein
MSLQLGYFNPDGSQNTTSSPAGNNVFNLVQMVVLNYLALHGLQGNFANLYTNGPGGSNPNNTLGSTAAQLDPLITYGPLASLVNGKVPG